MTQSLWFFGSRLTIVADHTTTAGQYDLIEEYSLPGSQIPFHLEHSDTGQGAHDGIDRDTIWAAFHRR
jgi:hypothetical protein